MSNAEHAWNRINARQRLELMDLKEHLAEQCEKATIEDHRFILARRYRNWIGVRPERRHVFREALQRVREHGRSSIEQLIERMGEPSR